MSVRPISLATEGRFQQYGFWERDARTGGILGASTRFGIAKVENTRGIGIHRELGEAGAAGATPWRAFVLDPRVDF
jgi:hypothetical protein